MSKLYLVPTPVGNLGDMTFRGVEVLKSVDLILAEDTRTSRVLLQHYGIETPLQSYHIFNEHQTVAGLVERLLSGTTIAVVTDAGTPGISDPGFLLVREAVKAGVEHKKGRQTAIQALANEERTMIIYESPYRLVKLLEQLIEVLGPDRQVSVSREISKLHAETARGTLAEVLTHFQQKEVKGEIVVILSGLCR